MAGKRSGIATRYGRIQISFQGRGKQFRALLTLKDTPKNRKIALQLKQHIELSIRRNEFNPRDYAEYFPASQSMIATFMDAVESHKTLREAVADYLSDLGRTREETTLEAYERGANRFLNAEYLGTTIGEIRITDLTPEMFRSVIRERGVTLKTANNDLIAIRGALDRAVNDDRIPHNPLDRVKVHDLAKDNSRPEPDPFTFAEIASILEAATEWPRFFNLAQVGFYSGLRVSEIMAVQWADIGKKIHVCRAHVMRRGKGTKTAAGNRYVDILPPALEGLNAQRKYTYWMKREVFCRWDRNVPLTDYEQINRKWRTILSNAGVRYRPFKQVRHTYASHMLSAGHLPRYVADQLGHKSVAMLDVYARWVEGSNEVFTGYTSA